MKKSPVAAATYKRLVDFASKKGSISLIATVISNSDPAVIQAYLEHMKQTDLALYKTWARGYKPPAAEPEEEDDDDDDDLLGPVAPVRKSKTAPPGEEDTAGLDELLSPPAQKKVMRTVTAENNPVNLVPGVTTPIPEKFKLRQPDGTTVELEAFSRHPVHGYFLRHILPKDERTFHIGGKPVTLDLLPLRRDPDGMTTVNGKSYSNSKLLAAAELETE